ncbi:MAG: retropepsin-like aspartic protease [Caldimonas sp.]
MTERPAGPAPAGRTARSRLRRALTAVPAWRSRALLSQAIGITALLCALQASGQTVSLGGSYGDKALLVIDGAPRSVTVGGTVGGVRLVSLAGSDAVVEVKGKRVALTLGGSPANLGGAPGPSNGARIVLTADSDGHFFTSGSINGKFVRFLVDTGATQVSLGQSEADRIGLDYRNGARGVSSTANGPVLVYRVSLAQLRVGDVQVYNIDATVLPAPMPHVLLGNTFLTRFQMKRENDTLTLDRRF